MIDERRQVLFTASTVVKHFHHRKSPTSRKQILKQRKAKVQTLFDEIVR